ncbi:MAG: hypothetical protein KIH69_016410 [Anaerolineae bacterium]|nr:hypothetical protein [Anaerolineae bacterium]
MKAILRVAAFASAGAVMFSAAMLSIAMLSAETPSASLPQPVQPQNGAVANPSLGIGDFVLSATLPAAPKQANVWNVAPPAALSYDDMRALAQRLRLRPELYRPQLMYGMPTSPTIDMPAPLVALGDRRELTMLPEGIIFNDQSKSGLLGGPVGLPNTNTPALPFAQASQIAERVLKDNGVLNFNYRIENPFINAYALPNQTFVQFAQIIDDAPIIWEGAPAVLAVVDHEGQVVNFMAMRFPQLALARTFAPMSAQAAWQQVTEGKGHYWIKGMEPRHVPKPSELPRSWLSNPAIGERADWVGIPTIYQPVEWQGKALLRIGPYIVSNYPERLLADIKAISHQKPLPLHIWGKIGRDSAGTPVFEIENWRKPSEKDFRTYFGLTVVTTDTKGVRTVTVEKMPIPNVPPDLMPADAPQRVVLLNPPHDLPKDKFVFVSGVILPEKQNNVDVMAWLMINELPSALLTPPPPMPTLTPSAPPPVNLVPITQVKGFETAAAISTTEIVLPALHPPPTYVVPAGNGTPAPPPTAQPVIIAPTPQPPPYQPGDRVEALEGRAHVRMIESYDGKQRRALITLAAQPDLPYLPDPLGAAMPTYLLIAPEGNADALAALKTLEKFDELRIRVWGRFQLRNLNPVTPDYAGTRYAIALERFELTTPSDEINWWIGKLMTATVQGRTVGVLQTRAGDRFIMRSSLTFVPPPVAAGQYDPWQGYIYGGKQGLVEGNLTNKTADGLRILDDIRRTYSPVIESATQPADLATVRVNERLVVIREPKPNKFTVSQVAFMYRSDQFPPHFNPLQTQQATTFSQMASHLAHQRISAMPGRQLIPTWRFSGKTDEGLMIDIYIDANQ